jgi:hypothetical protein
MRVPGLLHLKDPEDPWLITVVHEENRYYTEVEMLESFPAPEAKAPVAARPVRTAATADDWGKVVDALADWPATAQGTRHTVLLLACGVGRKFGKSDREVERDLEPIILGWQTGRDMSRELSNAVRWAYVSGELATVSGLRGYGVDIPKLSHPNAGEMESTP